MDEFGLGLGVGRVHEGDHPFDVLVGGGAGVHGDPLLSYEARLGPGDQQLGDRSGHRADLRALVPGPADLRDAGQQYLGRGLHGTRLGFGGGDLIRAGGNRVLGAERAVRTAPLDRAAARIAGARPGGESVAADAQQLVPGGSGGAEQRQLAGGGGQDGVRAGAGRAVQQQVQPGRGEPGQHVGVAQRPRAVRACAARHPGAGGPGACRSAPIRSHPSSSYGLRACANQAACSGPTKPYRSSSRWL